jgi:hypothetical protein
VTVPGRIFSAIVALAIAGSLLVLALPTRAAPAATLPAMAPAATTALTFTVNTNLDGVFPGACAGNTPGECTLREAVLEANANPGSTVLLPGLLPIQNYRLTITQTGTYNGTSGALYVNADMSIVGRPSVGRSVVIDGSGANDRVFLINNGVTASISNVTIRHGIAPDGGGVYNAGTLTLANSTVFSNTAIGGAVSGGGLYNAGALTLMNSAVISNTAGGLGGGGISNGSGGTLILSHSTVGGNTAGIAGGIRNFGSLLATDSTVSGNSACCGGGIYNDAFGTLTLDTSTVTGNTASDDGGGINNTGLLTVTTSSVAGNAALVGGGIVNGSGLVITGSLVISNTALAGGGIENRGLLTLVHSTVGSNTASNDGGGGIYNGGRLTLDGGTVISNTASGAGGGGIYVGAAGTLTLSKSTVAGNTASAGGGGIENAGSLVATNSTLSGNAGKYGGGLYSHGAASLTASTLDGNSAATGGGGFYQAAQYPTQTLSLANTIIANSPSGGNCAIDVTGYSPHSNGYNLSGDGTCAPYLTQPGDRNNADPHLGPLADNGGPTLTHLPQFPSPAMDAIPLGTNGCGTTLTTDQRSMPRALDSRCDIGAVENGARLSSLYLPLIVR